MKEFRYPTIHDFQRPYRWWRSLHPLNMIGSFNGYGSCDCGNSLWRGSGDFMQTYHGGHIICKACYKKFEKEIKLSDHYIMMQPRRDGVLICYDKECELHKEDSRFKWMLESTGKGQWTLKTEEWKKLK